MNRPFLAFFALTSWACADLPDTRSVPEVPQTTNGPLVVTDTVRTDWAPFFDAFNAIGTMVMLDVDTGIRHVFNPERAAERFPPASTFKVYNSLVALETGAVPNVDTVYAWDGIERGNAWDQDHSLRMGMRNSTVWLFQDIADRVGKEGYQEAFAREPYGNNLIGDSLRMFWLGQPLAISADEQIAFLNKLRTGDLAFRPDVQASVRGIMILEEEPAYTLYGKTGWAFLDTGHIGWIVGWVDRGGSSWVYALNVEPANAEFSMLRARRGILNHVLEEMRLRPMSDGE